MRFWKTLIFLCISGLSFSQVSKQSNSSELYEALQKLGNTGSAMYIAAHPDDENTRMIAWLANHKKVNTVYLSLTRGDGGQNLIGTEKGPMLGLLRTQELLQARSVDGGNQWFSRANDFGYSKTATETRAIWEEEEVLSDVVWAIRKHRPDILINRFDHDSNGRTHGHHTTSAILGLEAFKLAGDPTAFPEQLKYVEPWQPKRIFFNTSWWFYGSREAFAEADKSDMIKVDVGEYYPLKGLSNNEIASLSRSKHACQGFGSASARGSQEEWVQLIGGEGKPNMTDLFEGVDLSWNRVGKAGKSIETALAKAIANYDFAKPSASLNQLVSIYQLIQELPDSALKTRKLAETKELIRQVAGIYLEATTSSPYGVAGQAIDVNLELTNRSEAAVNLFGLGFAPSIEMNKTVETVDSNARWRETKTITLPEDLDLTSPYWLNTAQSSLGMYSVVAQEDRGRPEAEPQFQAQFRIRIGEAEFQFNEPVQYKKVDPAVGEIYQPFHIVPPVAVNIGAPVYLFANGEKGQIEVEVTSFVDNAEGQVQLDAGLEWIISQAKPYSIEQKGGKQSLTFDVLPPRSQTISQLKAAATFDGDTYTKSYLPISYQHVPDQVVFTTAEAVIEKVEITVPDVEVAYIQGSGDVVPESLRQLKLQVDELEPSQWTSETLSNYDVVILGIRAFNTLPELKYFTDDLWEFARNGGTVIVQYNTSRRLGEIAPFPLQLSRDRISQEDAELTFLAPNHPVLNRPNKITSTDFEGWVQERGLYFANEWDDAFTPILEGYDVGETPKQGALLVAPVGEGHYVYTGLSFFRELPAGVPGAYRLFANLLALDHE